MGFLSRGHNVRVHWNDGCEYGRSYTNESSDDFTLHCCCFIQHCNERSFTDGTVTRALAVSDVKNLI